ncbi:MAG: hypothetical protein QOE86_1085 [Solirubrobacteraceae bacterium]|jgi:hypothetical protein|nr:hypothetical protein [Solirubrobacteraceae bacterium]
MTETPRPTRDELLRLLGEASDLEHSLTCQYLFAAFSLKRVGDGLNDAQMTTVMGWARTLLMVARQEMEHLGLVANLLTAVGGSPWFGHPRFPYATPLFGHQMALEPFSTQTIEKFVCFERPDEVDPADAFCRAAPDPGRNVSALYERIRGLLIALDSPDLFVGPVKAEVTGLQLGTDFPRVGAMGGGYDVYLTTVQDLPSALAAVDLIMEQGEGAPQDTEISHYRRFLDVLEEVRATPGLDPARDVVANPSLTRAHPGTTHVTDPAAREVLAVFDAAYRTMLLLLLRLFAATDESEDELTTLRGIGFFPLMTMAVRPLAEVLTTLPAFAGQPDGPRAGPSFDTGGPVVFLPHRRAAWAVLAEQLDDLATAAGAAAAQPGVPERVGYIARSLTLIARRFAAGMEVT